MKKKGQKFEKRVLILIFTLLIIFILIFKIVNHSLYGVNNNDNSKNKNIENKINNSGRQISFIEEFNHTTNKSLFLQEDNTIEINDTLNKSLFIKDNNIKDDQINIGIKNENFEKNNISIELVKKRLEEIKLENKYNNISLSVKYVPTENNHNYNLDEISNYMSRFLSFSLTENNITDFNMSINPKISIIIPIYNSQNFLINLHNSIQDQKLRDLEIIYVDDCSSDNSTKIIENLQKKDKRIILLKNKKSRGPFYSRNKGALFSKGEYIQFIDSDDIIVGNILEKAYTVAKSQNVDIVHYIYITRGTKTPFVKKLENINYNIIYQPELSDIMYYRGNSLRQRIFFIFNQIIKTEIFLKSLIYIEDEYLKENLGFNEDLLQLFSILRVANSFKYIGDIGYAKMFYNFRKSQLNLNGITTETINKIFHDIFVVLKFLFNKTKNNSHDKAVCIDFIRVHNILYSSIMNKITEGYEFLDQVFNLLLNNTYYNALQRRKIEELKRNIMTNRKS